METNPHNSLAQRTGKPPVLSHIPQLTSKLPPKMSTMSWFFSSVAQSCPTLCDSMDCSTPGFPVFTIFTT